MPSSVPQGVPDLSFTCPNVVFVLQIAAACDFYTYIGHIAKGFIKLEGMLVMRNSNYLQCLDMKHYFCNKLAVVWLVSAICMCDIEV